MTEHHFHNDEFILYNGYGFFGRVVNGFCREEMPAF